MKRYYIADSTHDRKHRKDFKTYTAAEKYLLRKAPKGKASKVGATYTIDNSDGRELYFGHIMRL